MNYLSDDSPLKGKGKAVPVSKQNNPDSLSEDGEDEIKEVSEPDPHFVYFLLD